MIYAFALEYGMEIIYGGIEIEWNVQKQFVNFCLPFGAILTKSFKKFMHERCTKLS